MRGQKTLAAELIRNVNTDSITLGYRKNKSINSLGIYAKIYPGARLLYSRLFTGFILQTINTLNYTSQCVTVM